MMRAAAGVLFWAALAIPVGTAAAAPPPPPSELWSKYPAGSERIEPTPPPEPPREPPARPATNGPPAQEPTDRPVGALVAAALTLFVLALALLLGARHRKARPRSSAPITNGARRAQDVRAQLADLLAQVDASTPVPAPTAARASRVFDTVSGGFPQGRSETLSSEPQDPTQDRTDLGGRMAGILQAAEEAAEQIRADARAEAVGIRQRAEEAAAARAEHAEQATERLRSQAEHDAAEIRRNGESGASAQRREADEQASRMLADAENQARATREAAVAMERQIHESARAREQSFERETAPLEAQLRRTLAGLRELTSALEELTGARQTVDDGSNVAALEDRRVSSA